MEVDLLTVLSKPGLVASSHPEHVDAVYLQPIHHGAGPPHVVQPLPRRRRAGRPGAPPGGCGPARSPLVLHGETPGLGRILGQPPAQEQLVVSQRLLSVDHRSERRWEGGKGTGVVTRVFGGGCVSSVEGPTAYEAQALDELHLLGSV